jgi:hypothetical protein
MVRPMPPKWARWWFAATAAAVVAGVIIGMVLSAQHPTFRAESQELVRFGGSPTNRALNNLAFFTVQSNLIVGATSLLLALRLDRTATVFRVFRLIGLVAITVTFIVFHVTLSNLVELDTWGQLSNQLVHTVVPIMAVVGWLAWGPRGMTSARVATMTVIFPACYMLFTLVRGPLASHWYPYPFADVKTLGYAKVCLNGLWIALLFVALAAGATALDRRLARSAAAPEPGPATAP